MHLIQKITGEKMLSEPYLYGKKAELDLLETGKFEEGICGIKHIESTFPVKDPNPDMKKEKELLEKFDVILFLVRKNSFDAHLSLKIGTETSIFNYGDKPKPGYWDDWEYNPDDGKKYKPITENIEPTIFNPQEEIKFDKNYYNKNKLFESPITIDLEVLISDTEQIKQAYIEMYENVTNHGNFYIFYYENLYPNLPGRKLNNYEVYEKGITNWKEIYDYYLEHKSDFLIEEFDTTNKGKYEILS